MCGIYGVAGKDLVNEVELLDSVNKLEHRGPDDFGYYISDEIGIGMRRLAINELSTGHQPYITDNKTLGVVFNGEIYNYKELSKLENLPEHTSEAELISFLYQKYGYGFVNQLDGMFAIAIADFKQNTISLFRDPFGKKPLWILKNSDGSIEFSSEIKAFKSPKTFRDDFVSEYLLLGYVPFGNSAFNEITSVLPGSYAIWKEGKLETKTYWKLSQNSKNKVSYREAKKRVQELVEQSVIKRLISERPIGVYLSGGYDSSVVAAIMKKNRAEVNSYSIGFANPAFDESSHARKVANALKTNHHELILDFDVEKTVREIFAKVDLPFADSSIIPTYVLNRFAKEEIVVALGGDGGDEIFGGYDRYLFAPLISKYSAFFKFFPKTIFGNSNKFRLLNRKLSRLKELATKNQTLASQYTHFMSNVKTGDLEKLVTVPLSPKLSVFGKQIDEFEATTLRKIMLSDVNNYLVGDLLVKADLASMFNSVELRSPLLDRELAEYVYGLPDKYLIRGLNKKRLLKDIAHGLIPKSILKRPKMGFGVPLADWLRADLKELMFNTLSKNRTQLNSWIDMNVIDDLANRHQNGEDHSRTLWPVLALALWVENNL